MTTRYSLLLSPRADAAYFAQALAVAQAELGAEAEVRRFGEMVFLSLESSRSVKELARLSFVHGVFEEVEHGLRPLEQGPEFLLHPDFVWGEKYKGKTNETLTQLMINVGLSELGSDGAGLRLLDPMCGRGTTLLWAMRFGMHAVGVEQDGTVLSELRRGLKKWTKLHRVKHKLADGWVQKANKAGTGKYLDFAAAGASARVTIGDTSNAYDLIHRKQVDLIATDIPYGVQHMGGKNSRSPLEVLQKAAPVWADCLRADGAMVIAFNANIPKRPDLVACFEAAGLSEVPTAFEHRMSESILRDLAVFRKG